MARVGDDGAVGHPREAPAVARDDGRRAVELIAHQQDGVLLVEIGGRVGPVAAVGQQQVGHGRRRLELRVDAPAERSPVRVEGLGCVQTEEAGEVGQIVLPAAGDHDVAAPHQKAVARVDGRDAGSESGPKTGRVAWLKLGTVTMLPRFTTSTRSRPLPRARSTGSRIDTSAANSTRPAALRGASPTSVIRALAGCARVDGEAEPALQLLVGSDVAEGAPVGQGPAQDEVEVDGRHGLDRASGAGHPASTANASGNSDLDGHDDADHSGNVARAQGVASRDARLVAAGRPGSSIIVSRPAWRRPYLFRARSVMGQLDGKVAIVTGSGRGIGREVALRLARDGASVVVNDLDDEPAAETIKRIEAMGGKAVACNGDVTAKDFGERIVDTAVKQLGGLHVIVNNAGYTWDNVIQKMTDEQWYAILDVHLTAPFRILRAFAPVSASGPRGGDEARPARGAQGRQHLLDLRGQRQRRPDQLLVGQGRHHGHDQDDGQGVGPLPRHRQRRGLRLRPDAAHPAPRRGRGRDHRGPGAQGQGRACRARASPR